MLLVQGHAFVTELSPLKVCQLLEVSSLLVTSPQSLWNYLVNTLLWEQEFS
jgi:hypothetical protein